MDLPEHGNFKPCGKPDVARLLMPLRALSAPASAEERAVDPQPELLVAL
ncbi:hypothetical protein ACWDYH_21505 [Nocardia goodfellowii]